MSRVSISGNGSTSFGDAKRDRIVSEYITGTFEKAANDEKTLKSKALFYDHLYLQVDTQKPDAGRGPIRKLMFEVFGMNYNSFPGDIGYGDLIGNPGYEAFQKKLDELNIAVDRMTVYNNDDQKQTVSGTKATHRTTIALQLRNI